MEKLAAIYWGDLKSLKFVTIPLCVLAAGGLFLRSFDQDNDGDLMLILHILDWWVLALMLLYVAIARAIGLFVWDGVLFTKITVPLMGMALWCLFFASAFKADDFGMGLLYLVAAFIETWICSRAIADYMDNK